MFLAIPLATRPSWRSPPWVTVLLIVLNALLYFGWQVPEKQAVARAARAYAQTPLPAIELPAFVAHLHDQAQRSGKARMRAQAQAADRALAQQRYALLYQWMWHDPLFRQALASGQVILPAHPQHAQWQQARAGFAPSEAQAFTPRWAQNHASGAPWAPITWLTNAFLHGSAGHWLGNMVFLFLFGFTLELALGPGLYLACYLLGAVGASALAAWAYAGQGGLGLGASGAVSALMGMYVVLYRFRRIPFFYMLLFYFNYARWPALLMLPVWLAYELVLHFAGSDGVAYMAHLGGLLTGAALMALLMALGRAQAPAPHSAPGRAQPPRPEQAQLSAMKAKARLYAQSLRFADAAAQWQRMARLAPRDLSVLKNWFDCARHEPASESFHAAARHIFKLSPRHAANRQLQVACWREYLQRARPGVRLSARTVQQLVRSLVLQEQLHDAEILARLLLRSQPLPPGGLDALTLLIDALLRAGQTQRACAWLPALQQHAPQLALTARLQELADAPAPAGVPAPQGRA